MSSTSRNRGQQRGHPACGLQEQPPVHGQRVGGAGGTLEHRTSQPDIGRPRCRRQEFSVRHRPEH